jgi:transposase
MSNRTALINQMRGMLTEFGLVMPKGVNYVLKSLSTALEQRREQIPGGVLDQIEELRAELASLEREIAKFERKIERYAKITPIIKRLMEVLGVGPLTATALFVICTNPANYKNGRCFSASLGLVPWHNNSGEHHWIGHITKRGDTYARMLLIHGARAALCSPKLKNRHDPHSLWMKSLIERKGMNRAAVALANKNARIIWALMAKNDEFRLPQAA